MGRGRGKEGGPEEPEPEPGGGKDIQFVLISLNYGYLSQKTVSSSLAMHPLPAEWDLLEAPGLRPGIPIGLFELGDMRNFVYVLVDWESRECAIVDPNRETQALFDALDQHSLRPTHLLLTHSHFDHVGGVRATLERYTELKLYVHALEAHRLSARQLGRHPSIPLQDLQELRIGALTLQVLHTPGHTAGECCFYLPSAPGMDQGALLSGDTVFVGNVGRTDLDTGSDTELFSTLQRLKTFPQETLLFPGHHYAPACITTLGAEMRTNSAFLCKNVEELAALP